MRLVKLDDIFIFQCTYYEKDIAKGAGFLWNPDSKRWYTKSVDSAIKLSDYASDELREEMEAIQDERIKTYNQSSAITLQENKSFVCPPDLSYFEFQKTAIDFMIKRPNVLLSEPTGIGKTIEIIGLINNSSFKKILVVCPNSLKLNWKRELKKWLVNNYSISVISSTCFEEADIMIINYEILYKYVNELTKEWDLLVCDESHKLKNGNTRTYKSLKSLAKKTKKKVFATGTPVLNKPAELWTSIEQLDRYLFPSKWSFLQTYCDAKQTYWGWDFSGASNLEELQYKLRSSIMMRREKHQLLDLPPKIVQIVNLIGDDLEDIVEQEKMELEKIKQKYEDSLEKMSVPFLLFESLAKIRHKTALAKVPKVAEFVEDLLESDEKVVIFAHHKDVIDSLYGYFMGKSVKLDGDMSLENRQNSIDEFQNNDKIKVFVGSILASGLGITLTAASKVVFAELDWVPANITQCEDRSYRIGTKDKVNIYHLVIDNTVDVKLAETIIRKQKMVDKVLEKSYIDLKDIL